MKSRILALEAALADLQETVNRLLTLVSEAKGEEADRG